MEVSWEEFNERCDAIEAMIEKLETHFHTYQRGETVWGGPVDRSETSKPKHRGSEGSEK